jgi:hypothetical protein
MSAAVALALALTLVLDQGDQACITSVDAAAPMIAAFKTCAADEARRLERSKESADSIATAAIAECGPIRSKIEGALLSCLTQDQVVSVLSDLDAKGRGIATEVVVEIRAAPPKRRAPS